MWAVMSGVNGIRAFLLAMAMTQIAVATASPRRDAVRSPIAKAKRILTKERLAKVRPIRAATDEKSLTYRQGDTNVEVSIGPESHGPLALWSVKTTKGKATIAASTVVDALYPFAMTYNETDVRPNGDVYSESADISRVGYEGVPEKDKPVKTTLRRGLSRTTKNGVRISVDEIHRFGKQWRNPAPAQRKLEILSQGAVVSVDLLAAQPIATGSVTTLVGDALAEMRAFLGSPDIALSAAAIDAIVAAVTAAPVVAVNADPMADIRAQIKAAMATW